MINSLDEAIKHCEEVAEKNEKECKNWAYGASQINDDENRKKQYQKHAEMWHECANEHRQLADWLKELKAYKELNTYNRTNPCSECKYEDSAYNCDYCIWNYVNNFEQKEVNSDEASN